MKNLTKSVWILLFSAVIVGAIALEKWGIPAPSTTVQRAAPLSEYIQEPAAS